MDAQLPGDCPNGEAPKLSLLHGLPPDPLSRRGFPAWRCRRLANSAAAVQCGAVGLDGVEGCQALLGVAAHAVDPTLKAGAISERTIGGTENSRARRRLLCGDRASPVLQEIPEVHLEPSVATHTCTISRADGKPFVGEELKGLLEDDLRPFLALMFGQPIQFSMVEGHSSSMNGPSAPWGTVFPRWPEEDQSPARNWFTITTSPCDVPSLFDSFCVLPDGLKRHFHKVIRKYVTSETLGHMSRAEMLIPS